MTKIDAAFYGCEISSYHRSHVSLLGVSLFFISVCGDLYWPISKVYQFGTCTAKFKTAAPQSVSSRTPHFDGETVATLIYGLSVRFRSHFIIWIPLNIYPIIMSIPFFFIEWEKTSAHRLEFHENFLTPWIKIKGVFKKRSWVFFHV